MGFYKQVYAPKFSNLDKGDLVFERRKLPKFFQDEINNQNSPLLDMY